MMMMREEGQLVVEVPEKDLFLEGEKVKDGEMCDEE